MLLQEEMIVLNYKYKGMEQDVKTVLNTIGARYKDSSKNNMEWAVVNKREDKTIITSSYINSKTMPQLTGMNLKDAVYICENIGLKVNIRGKGKVMAQSLTAGEPVAAGQLISLQLN